MNLSTEASTNITSSVDISVLDLCVYGFNVLFGLPTHCCLTWLMVRKNGVTSEFFFLNLSFCEIGTCLNCLLVVLSSWCFPLGVVSLFFIGLGVTGRPLFQCLICVERYLAVLYPVTFLKLKPLRYRLVCSAVTWVLTLGSCYFCMASLLTNISAYIWFFLPQFFLFMAFQLWCCLAVLRALNRSGPGERAREREEESRMKRKAFNIILILTVSMFVIYTPFIVAGVFTLVVKMYIKEVWDCSFTFFMLGGFVQPLLYLQRFVKLSCFS